MKEDGEKPGLPNCVLLGSVNEQVSSFVALPYFSCVLYKSVRLSTVLTFRGSAAKRKK